MVSLNRAQSDSASCSDAAESRIESHKTGSSESSIHGSAPTKEISPSGTIIDPQFHAADELHVSCLATIQRVAEIRRVEAQIEDVRSHVQSLVPGYRLLNRIGKGAYGTVWEAQSSECADGHVAVKFFTCSQWEAMHREVSRIALLEGCTGVLPFKQFADKQADPPYYIMPFARNGSLADLIRRQGPMSVDEALKVFTRVVETMAFVHAKGVIHCDLKPANILLNESGEPLVADFGQAQHDSEEPNAFGTLFYMPPEQAVTNHGFPEASWDVYALGAILFEMLTGQRPRENPEMIARLTSIKDVRKRLVSYSDELRLAPRMSLRQAVQQSAPAKAAGVDVHLASLVERCLAVDPNDRPRGAEQLLDLLRQREYLNHRRRAVAGGIAVTLLFLVALATLAISGANRIIDERERQARHQVNTTLARTTRIAGQLIQEKLRDRVQYAQEAAERAEKAPWINEMAEVRDKFRALPGRAEAALSESDRKTFSDWLVSESHHMPWYQWDVGSRGMALIAVVDGRGYWLSRLHPNGVPDGPTLGPDSRRLFRANWSWRDYFCGTGNHFEEEGKDVAHSPIERIHISHVYKARVQAKPWRIDVASPIRDAKGEVVAILISGIEVKGDLLYWLARDDNQSDGQEIVLINDRGAWAWHPRAESGRMDGKDPEPHYAKQEWFDRNERGDMTYRDPLTGAIYQASYMPIYPYQTGLNEDPVLVNRKWMVLVQLKKEIAEEPLSELRQSIRGIGLAALFIIGGMVAALWYWWLRAMRRQELTAYG